MQNIQALKLTKTKEAVFAAGFTALAVYAPMVVHYFGGVNAGRKFLPMPFFVLLAGLLLGWRAGLAAGLFSPVISYLLSGMPALPVLPIIIIQLSAFGFFAGILKEKHGVLVSLAGAIILGFLLTGVAVLFFSKMNAVMYVINALKDGLPGIAMQLILLPIISKFSRKYQLSAY